MKTIYIGYDIDGEMLAALYAHEAHVEIALALPEDAESELLIDATHLTWRTLPVAAVLRTPNDLAEFGRLVGEAAARIVSRQHDVSRDNEFFATRRIRRGRT